MWLTRFDSKRLRALTGKTLEFDHKEDLQDKSLRLGFLVDRWEVCSKKRNSKNRSLSFVVPSFQARCELRIVCDYEQQISHDATSITRCFEQVPSTRSIQRWYSKQERSRESCLTWILSDITFGDDSYSPLQVLIELERHIKSHLIDQIISTTCYAPEIVSLYMGS